RLAEVHHQVQENFKISGEVMKRRYDLKSCQSTYKPGDKVWLYNPRRKKGQSPKLMSDWEGPYAVMEGLSAMTFCIKGGKKTKPKVIHANRLWKYHGS
uniref:Integrase p58-like C-terminal domain-containing protein n=1 Tax=Latimeria chalumnae TaxID=7897 RepID=H3AYN2_LATCH